MDIVTGFMMATIAVFIGFILTGFNIFTVTLAPLVLGMLYFASKSTEETLKQELENEL